MYEEVRYKIEDVIMTQLRDYPLWPARVVELLTHDQYRIQFFGQRKVEVVRAKEIMEYKEGKRLIFQAQSTIRLCKQLKEAIDLADKELEKKSQRQKRSEDKTVKMGKGSKTKQLEIKKQRKMVEHIVCITRNKKKKEGYANSTYSNPCAQLRALFDKLSSFISHSWCSNQPGELSERQLDRLKAILSPDNILDIYDILSQWMVQYFIVLIKQMQQSRFLRYLQLEQLVKQKYRQLVHYIRSEDFQAVEIGEERRKMLMLKIQKNSLDLY